MHPMTTTVNVLETRKSLSLIPINVYSVPVAAHQCIPDTAADSTIADAALFGHVFAHAARKTVNMATATILAATAITTDPTICAVL